MSGQALTEDGATRAHHRPMPSDISARSMWLYRLLPLFVFLLATGGLMAWYWTFIVTGGYVPLIFSVILSVFLSLLPAMICVVQNTTRRRQVGRLSNLDRFPVGGTLYFRTALVSVDTVRTGAVDSDFGPALFTYFFILFIGFFAVLIGYSFQAAFKIPSVVLGGMHLTTENTFVEYQLGTFCVIATAFLAAYVYSLGRLLDRVNNNDLYPISLYYYAVRVVIACVVAAVARHTADVFAINSTPALLLIGFGIGFAPDLFVLAMIRRAFQAMKIWGTRDDPAAEVRPTSLPLLMIDDLSRDKIDRLGELGIETAQVLARQNPFLLLPRLPYDLALLVDWIGQAQLYVLVRDQKLAALRAIYIRDVFDLRIRLQSDSARAAVCAALGITEPEASALEEQLGQDPSFVRLGEVRAALIAPLPNR